MQLLRQLLPFVTSMSPDFSKRPNPIRMNDSETFDQMYRVYFAPLCLYSSKYIDRKDAEDVVNNLFLKLWDRAATFESYQHAQSVLYLAVRNACLDFMKVSGRRNNRHEEVRALSDQLTKNFELEMIENEFWAEVYREIQNLPTQCSNIMRMSYIEGLSNDEVASTLNISAQTVRNQKVKGLKVLREWAKKNPRPEIYLFFILFFDKT